MKKQMYSLFAGAAALALTMPAMAEKPLNRHTDEKTRTIRLVQDDAQDRLTTKVYSLKNIKASDIHAYVAAAALRRNTNSKVRSLNFRAANQQNLIVTTAEDFFPYIDQIISVLDRGSKADQYGSKVSGAGYKWQVYWTKYRNPTELLYLADVMGTSNTTAYYKNGAVWVKDDQGDMEYVLDWMKYFDRPVPQVQVTFRYYSVRESNLRDIGIDYLAWKNGPGMDLLSVGYNAGHLAWDKIFSEAVTTATTCSWGYGGVFTAPAFDASFIRLLQQSGNAKVAASATLNVINDQQTPARIYLTPDYNRIIKNSESAEASVVGGSDLADFRVTINARPTICFFTEKKDLNDMGWIPATPEFYARNKGSFIFSYKIYSKDASEANNYGDQIGSAFETSATLKTIDLGREQMLASVTREYDVEQTIGVPFLCQLPILKYIFGTTTTMKEKIHSFITVEANLVHPEAMPKAQLDTPAKAPAKAPAKKAAANVKK